MECPICIDTDLQPSKDPLTALECAQCGGGFLSASAVNTLVSDHLRLNPEVLPDLQSFSKREPVPCAGCSSPTSKIQLKGVEVDWCSACGGFWLAGGGLHRLSGGRWGTSAPKRQPSERLSTPARLSLDRLMKHREYGVRQDPECNLATLVLGWDQANWYDVRGPMGTALMAVEQGGGLMQAWIRNLTENQGRNFYVVNRGNTEILLECIRPWFLLAASMEVKLAESNKRIGRVQRTLNPIMRTWELSDETGRMFARVRGPLWRPWTFFIEDPFDGSQLGVVRKRWAGWFQESFTRGDNFTLDFGTHEWTLEQRCILLATTISIDLDSFEQRS